MVAALLSEMELRRDYLQAEMIETVYFGGGTPSLLDIENLRLIIENLQRFYSIEPTAEVTLEANPDDITEEKLQAWGSIGINRLSIGIQSFFEEDLQWMNRAHNAKQALDSLALAKNYFDNITIDLIYGTPQLTNEKWKHNIDTAIALDIPHLSCYALTVEPKTPLHKMIREHRSDDVNPDKQSEQFLLLMEWMQYAGYEHYEISNFAKSASPAGSQGWRSKHNSSYWQGKKYTGIGPSAHSFNGSSRQWNISNNSQYISSLEKGIIPAETEVLTAVQQKNEYIMTSLRTMEGIDLSKMIDEDQQTLRSASKKYISNHLLEENNNHLQLTREGKLLADGIAASLFF